jgi:membrane protease YdiL (CAAX protease family)
MDPNTAALIWLNLARAGILLLTALLSWITYRSHLLLKEFQPDVNLLLSLPELVLRLGLVGICLGLAWLSGLSAAEFGWLIDKPVQTIMLGIGLGLITVLMMNLVTTWSINRFGRQIYSPLVIQNILPRRPLEWVLTALALLPPVLMEELLFRSLWLGCFRQLVFLPLLIIGVSLIFGLMHQPQGRLGMILSGGINILFSLLFLWSGQLLLTLVAHYTTNFLQLAIASRQKEWLENY